MAVFPVEDLSEGRNGVNFVLTELLRTKLQGRGMDVVSTDDVVSYMAKNRIRNLGVLGKSSIYQARESLGADFIMLATVSQRQQEPVASIGLVLTFLRTKDAHIIWSEAAGVSKADVTKMFAVDEPQSVDDLLSLLSKQLLDSCPQPQDIAETSQSLIVESVRLAPKYVQAGNEVKCAISLRPPEGHDTLSQVLLKIDDNTMLDMVETAPNQYTAYWNAPDKEGTWPVDLILVSQTGGKQAYFLGNYQIDTSAPAVSLSVSGKQVDNFVAFNTSLPISPVWLKPEPLSHWSLNIQTPAGHIMSSTESFGPLPPLFIWNGQRADGRKAEDGVYDVVLNVWDRADNYAVAVKKVLLKNNPPVPEISGVPEQSGIQITLDSADKSLVDFWSAEFIYTDGEIFFKSQGKELPADLHLPLPKTSETRKLEAVITMKDVLGNKVQKKIDDLQQIMKIEEITPETQMQQEWFPEF